MLLRNKFFQRLSGGRLERVGTGFVSRVQQWFLSTHKSSDILGLIQQNRRELRGTGPIAIEAFVIHSIARAQTKVPGDFAEVGVFTGGSARMICEAKGDKHLRLFDTFAGLPEGREIDGAGMRPGMYACSQAAVARHLDRFPNISYYPGIFPDSVHGNEEVENARFALAHFDVDLYEGTLGCLEFFYPRMNPGGVLMTHDYSVLAGVKQAFDEFFADKPEGPIEFPTTQCMVVKR